MRAVRSRLGAATIVAGALFASSPAVGQTPATDRAGLWVTAAIGPTAPYDLGIVASAALRYNRMVVRARYASTGEFSGDWFEDLGLLVGVVVTPTSARASQLAIGAGVGRARCRHCGFLVGQPDPAPTMGFLVDAEGRLALTTSFGATASVFGDFNSTLSFGGVAFGLFVGKL